MIKTAVKIALLIFVGAYSANAERAVNPCKLPEVAKMSDSKICTHMKMSYRNTDADGTSRKESTGHIVRISDANDSAKIHAMYFVANDGNVVKADWEKQRSPARLAVCMLEDLGFDNRIYGPRKYDVPIRFFGGNYNEYDGRELYHTIEMRWPFTGKIRMNHKGQCIGKAGYADHIVTFKEAVQKVETAFKQELGSDVQPVTSYAMFFENLAGFYYTFMLHDQSQPPAEDRKMYFYRVDLEEEGEPGVVLVRIATEAELREIDWERFYMRRIGEKKK